MKNAIQFPIAMGLALGLQATSAQAGQETTAPATAAPSNSGDWCDWLQNKPGTLYKNAENPILQYFQIGGRFQYQAAYLDGEDATGRDFNDTYDDYRRVRLESKIDFLKFFSANIKLNMVNDGRPSGNDLDWGYDTFDEAVFSFDIKKAFGAGSLDVLKLNYGRFKFNMTEEVHMSSKEIYTVERSAIANKLYGANNRPTGVTLDAAMGKWSGTVGFFSGEDDSEFIGG
ncbi:MAG: OprO/OprP family phosphate-selective porin, partial [Akkermansiaceae bacterium]|nr:OprO/OprP family phosphate-selective porin [Akkermansiaceae bacterium]